MERQFSRLVHAVMWSLPPDDTEVEALRQRLREDRQRAREAGRAPTEAEQIQMSLEGNVPPDSVRRMRQWSRDVPPDTIRMMNHMFGGSARVASPPRWASDRSDGFEMQPEDLNFRE